MGLPVIKPVPLQGLSQGGSRPQEEQEEPGQGEGQDPGLGQEPGLGQDPGHRVRQDRDSRDSGISDLETGNSALH